MSRLVTCLFYNFSDDINKQRTYSLRPIILDKKSMSQKFQPPINISTNYTKCQLRTILKYLYQFMFINKCLFVYFK